MSHPATISHQHDGHQMDIASESQSVMEVRLGQGIVAAVLHVAAAGARGSRELAMELAAARHAVDSETDHRCHGSPFDASFSRHLSPRAFADLLQRQRSTDLALEPLNAAGVELLQQGNSELLETYGKLVVAAAKAAAAVRTEEGLLRWRRVEYSERRALDEICSTVAAPQSDCRRVLR